VSSSAIQRQLEAAGSDLLERMKTPDADNDDRAGDDEDDLFDRKRETKAASLVPPRWPVSNTTFVAYRFLPGAFEQMVLQAMVPDMPGAGQDDEDEDTEAGEGPYREA
jgi:hypothetical protein